MLVQKFLLEFDIGVSCLMSFDDRDESMVYSHLILIVEDGQLFISINQLLVVGYFFRRH